MYYNTSVNYCNYYGYIATVLLFMELCNYASNTEAHNSYYPGPPISTYRILDFYQRDRYRNDNSNTFI